MALLLQNYLQSEEDEWGAFLIVFLRRLGASLPIALVLAEYGFYAFWFVYPLAEIVTLVILYFYKRSRGERHTIDPARVYSATFLGRVADVAAQIDSAEAFAKTWGAGEKTCNTLRLAMEEICGVMNERAARQEGDPLLSQLTLIAQEDGTLTLHLRDDGKELDPFRLSVEQADPESKPVEDIDVRALGLHAVCDNRTGRQNVGLIYKLYKLYLILIYRRNNNHGKRIFTDRNRRCQRLDGLERERAY